MEAREEEAESARQEAASSPTDRIRWGQHSSDWIEMGDNNIEEMHQFDPTNKLHREGGGGIISRRWPGLEATVITFRFSPSSM